MNTLIAIIIVIFLFVIMDLLNEILSELRLAKHDREDDRSQSPDWINPKLKFDKEE